MKRILVALDASPIAQAVLDQAQAIARATGARLLLFRAVALPVELPAEVFLDREERVQDFLLDRARKELDALTVHVPPDLLLGVQAKLGSPWDAICEAARREEVDLIVIGSHGYRGWDRLLGTTAAKVVNHADRNVFVVRAPQKK